MKTTDEILELLRQFKSVAGEKYGIEQLALFGSAARGEQREDSDIDICVKLHKTTFRTYMAIKEELEHLFHIKVDLLTLHENMRQLFRQNIPELPARSYHQRRTQAVSIPMVLSGYLTYNSYNL